MVEKRAERWLTILFFLSFLAQAVFCALRIQESIFPDEAHHLHLATFFSAPGVWRLHDSPETWGFGPISRYPYLYHLAMGKLLALCPASWNEVLYLRLWNVAISAFAMAVVFFGIQKHLKSAEERLAARAVVCHLPMLSFLGGAVTYDNTVYGLVALSVLLLIDGLKKPSRLKILLSTAVLMVASLVKFVVLPFFLIFGLILMIHLAKSADFRKVVFRRRMYSRESWVIAAFVMLFALNVDLYGTNLAVYHQIMPSADRVLGHDVASQHYAQFQRDESFIKTAQERPLMPFKGYFRQYLTQASKGIFSIFAHRSVDRAQYVYNRYLWALVPLLWGALALVFRRFRDFPDEIAYFLLTSLIYGGVAVGENYASYRVDHVFGAGIQGRYLFPALLPALLAASWLAFTGLKAKKLRIFVLVALATVFIQNSLIFMLPHMESAFFR